MEDLAPNPGDLDPIETASRDEISALQLDRMKWSLKHAYENSPFYRKRFDETEVHPDDLKTLSDLAKFPFTVKDDLRDAYEAKEITEGDEVIPHLKSRLKEMLPNGTPKSSMPT